jgi:DNA topoisomerase VI subunit B
MSANASPKPPRPSKGLSSRSGHSIERTAFKTSRLMEFCSRRELVALTGEREENWPLVILKELVDNALDEAETSGVLPVIRIAVSTGKGTIAVSDNGPGMPAAVVAGILDFTARTSTKEAYVSPTRGQQGNALSTILPMPFALSEGGDGGRVVIEALGTAHTITFRTDPLRQEPVTSHSTAASPVKSGTRITVHWPESACSILVAAKEPFLQLAEHFAFLNPHLILDVAWDDDQRHFAAFREDCTKWRASEPTSPHWYSQERLERLIGAQVVHDQENGRERTLREFIADFRGLRGTQKQKLVLERAGLSGSALSTLCTNDGFETEKIAALLEAMRAETRPVKPQQLGLIGEDALSQRFLQIGADASWFKYAKEVGVTDGLPWVVEVAFGLPSRGQRRLMAGINWSPAISNPFHRLGSANESLDELLAKQEADSFVRSAILVHLACPRIDFTDRGKSALALPAEIGDAILKAVAKCTKKWAKYRRARSRQSMAAFDRELNARRVDKPDKFKEAAFACMEEAYLAASAGGTLPASARQVMYQARPLVQARTGKQLDDHYFTQILLPDYMREHSVDWDVVFDERGHFIEPHTRSRIGLGTLAVRSYTRGIASPVWADPQFAGGSVQTHGPEGRFGAVLFIEKEGFLPLLERVRLAERFDIAIMSTKGVSNTSARRLIDRLADEKVKVLVLHDFDKAGFTILHTLTNDTRRYEFKNEIEVIDLGLRLDDVNSLNLQAEAAFDDGADAKKRDNLLHNGATAKEAEFLLRERVELNAMSSDQFVRFLEDKLKQNGIQKVVPNGAKLDALYRRHVQSARVEALVQDAIQTAEADDSVAVPGDLAERVAEYQKSSPAASWDEALARIVRSDLEGSA